MTRIHRIIEFALLITLIAGTIYAARILLRDTGISTMLSNVRGIICTPSRRDLILVPRPYPPGFEPMLVLPEPPRGWHYRPDDRLETDAQ